MLVFSVLLWLHIFSAVGWLGGAMVFGLLIGPSLGTLTPQARGEVVLKLFPKYVRYVALFSGMTVIFGLALVFDIGLNAFALDTPFGLYLSIGAVLALVTVILAFSVITPSARKLIRLTEEMVKNSTPPSPELPKAAARLRVAATIALVLLVLVLVFMVAGATA